LLDGDTVIFAGASTAEYEARWDEWLWTLHADFGEAVRHVDHQIASIVEGLKGDGLIIALSDNERFRPKIMPEYKANRKGRKPVVYQAVRDYVHEKYETYQRPGLEGDDVLGILGTHPKIIKGEKVIVSIDKDLKTIPGLHNNYAKGHETHTISVSEADYYHLFQTLTGDTTDGYKGCPGIGPVKAQRLLEPAWRNDEFDVVLGWQIVLNAYLAAKLGEEVALQNARVARILRDTDYDFDRKEVILWTPQQ
jgi:DNA polymerase-1